MDTITAIANIISTGLSMIDRYVNDPKRRLKARQEYVDECKKMVEEILNEKDMEELDKLLLDLISAVHNL